MEKNKIILLDTGVLVAPDFANYEHYARVYDQKHGYYDEDQEFYQEHDLEDVKEAARQCVQDGVENTYAVITRQPHMDCPVEKARLDDADYSLENVIFAVCKKDGKVIDLGMERA